MQTDNKNDDAIDSSFRAHLIELSKENDLDGLRAACEELEPFRIAELFALLPETAKMATFRALPEALAAQTFENLEFEDQEYLLKVLRQEKVGHILDAMSPDDRTALLERLSPVVQHKLLSLLKEEERNVAISLLGYPKGSIGRFMTPEYVAVRSEMTVAEALRHIREHAPDSDTINVIYVIDDQGKLIDAIYIRKLLLADPRQKVRALEMTKMPSLYAGDLAENAVETFRHADCYALPVVTATGEMVGIVTMDDVLDLAEERATREFQKMGGSAQLEEPYLRATIPQMLWKRGPWLVVLFLGGLFTANTMALFEAEIAKAVVLTLFLPLIIASGGNTGSQAATLIIRAMATGELRLRDWGRVLLREIVTGLLLGLMLGLVGLLRVALDAQFSSIYTEHWLMFGFTIGMSLVGVVLWGSVVGSMLPFVLRKMGLDPATSSAPFVSTLVDVTGIAIYFSVAALLLKGTLL